MREVDSPSSTADSLPALLALCGVSFCWSRSCSLAGSEGFTLRAINLWRTRWLGGVGKSVSRGSNLQLLSLQIGGFRTQYPSYWTHLSGPIPIIVQLMMSSESSDLTRPFDSP